MRQEVQRLAEVRVRLPVLAERDLAAHAQDTETAQGLRLPVLRDMGGSTRPESPMQRVST
ncbi:hypothetical protein [Nonomuraea dietziae]|uniref:hypothetical protein n=1 Tax=Nonomuraea dietziae TaxID=65515 RepID=UPI0031D0D03E